ncbi:hypothetical protein NBM05_02890 [Rothia sp. AR01]|uniref:Uncharacterized protein n=1 Tax=Rothia santali TaxID=2949643 RepID=A0A9X2KHP4_9MICC|nr:hypothetical protein [Rothia santali]MCP3425004.1 hypothetical protein [Rothia santali]
MAVGAGARPWLRGLGVRGLARVTGLSVLGWAGFLAMFALSCAAIAPQVAGADVPGLGAITLGGMSVPLNVGGWGPREGAAAFGFGLLGYPGGVGLSVSVGYGVLALASTLPGAAVLVSRLARRRRSRV